MNFSRTWKRFERLPFFADHAINIIVECSSIMIDVTIAHTYIVCKKLKKSLTRLFFVNVMLRCISG